MRPPMPNDREVLEELRQGEPDCQTCEEMGSNCALSDEEKDAIRNVLDELKAREGQVDEQQQWLDEINVALGPHTVFQKERLARIDELKAENELLRDQAERWIKEYRQASNRAVEAEAENDRLRAELERFKNYAVKVQGHDYAKINKVEARIEEALALHEPCRYYIDEMGDRHDTTDEWCTCGKFYPCPTVKALRGEE